MMRCEAACAASRYPTSFILMPAPGKGEDRLVMDCCRGETLWAVFDGHRGQEVAGHASRTVPQLVWANMSMSTCPGPGEAISTALRHCHEMARNENLRGGSTAVVVATMGEYVYCGSAGDSRVVASLHGGGIVRMSKHHSTSSAEEVARIQAAGGNLEWGRLGGFLPVTRGLGNFDLEADGFSSMPDVTSLPRRQVEFVIIASDGLWDVMSDEDCCRLVRQWGVTASAERLAITAQQLGSNDDIAVIIARFPIDGIAAAHLGA
jgi:serine/threonine protein phosphatase PrpC